MDNLKTATRDNKKAERELQNYALALFDVLGFSDLHKKLGTEKLYLIYEELIDKAIIEKTKEGVKFLGATREGLFVVGNLEVRFVYFSDTILLWTPFEEVSFPFFVTICSELMIDAIDIGLSLRGAITIGDAIMDRTKGIFMGEPIIEAARLEKAQNWIGVTFGSSFNKIGLNEAMINFTDIQLNYLSQMKEGYEKLNSRVVLDWARKMRELNKTELIKSKLTTAMNSTDKKSYYENTFAFFDYSDKNQNWIADMKKQSMERYNLKKTNL